jgi:hypothetical protein
MSIFRVDDIFLADYYYIRVSDSGHMSGLLPGPISDHGFPHPGLSTSALFSRPEAGPELNLT